MKIPSEVITLCFGESTERARECLHEKKELHDIRWAYSVLITEEILLAAFRETDTTSKQSVRTLIQEARRKLQIKGYIEIIAEKNYKAWSVPLRHQPSFSNLRVSVCTTLKEVISSLTKEPWYETLKNKPAYRAARTREKENLKRSA